MIKNGRSVRSSRAYVASSTSLTIIAGLLASIPAWAQTPPASQVSEAVVITGTLLRGIAPTGSATVGVTKDVITATGKSSTVDLLATIPQVNQFNTIPAGGAGQGAPTVRPSLRGLASGSGSSPTLILFNGHRAIGAGILQTVPDPSVLPPGVMDRVDVVPDGGSSIYGSDAVAGVINFITKKRYDGAEISGHYGEAEGGYNTHDLNLTLGKDWGSGSAYISFANNKHNAIFGNQRDFVTADNRPKGGSSFLSTVCSPGTVTVAGTTYTLPGLTAGAANTCDPTDLASYYPKEERNSLYAHLFQELSDTLRFEAEAYTSQVKSTVWSAATLRNASGTITSANPYYRQIAGTAAGASQSVSTSFGIAAPSYNVFDAYGVTGTLTWDLNDNWQLRTMANIGRSYGETLDYSQAGGTNPTALAAAYAGTTTATAFNPYDPQSSNAAVLSQIGEWSQYANAIQRLGELRVIADGSLFDIAAGSVRLAAGAEYHYEGYEPVSSNTGITGQQQKFTVKGSRNVRSVFGELFIPIVSSQNSMPGVRSFDISLSARNDDYSGAIGSTTNPKIGFNYKPVADLTLRANWGKSFNAPSMADTNAVDTRAQSIGRIFAASPSVPAQAGNTGTLLFAGGNQNLTPEKATTYSIGGDWKVSAVPGLTASLTYWDIEYKNRIQVLVGQIFSGAIFSNPALSSFYILQPTLAQLQTIFQGTRLDGFTLQQLYANGSTGPYIYADARRFNVAATKTNGIDFNFAYNTRTSFGSFNTSLGGTYKLKSESTAVPGAVPTDDLKNGTGKLALVVAAGATSGPYTGRLSYNYLGGYPVVQVNNSRIKAFQTVNAYLAYDLGKAGMLKGTTVSLNIDNIGDQDPPYSNVSGGTANGSTVGRLVTLGFNVKF